VTGEPACSADLHVHTNASDGVWSPQEAAAAACEMGLYGIAVTDHDTCAGIEAAAAAGHRLGVRIVPGIELSCHDGLQNIHILGYFIDPSAPVLIEGLAALAEDRRRRAALMVDQLRRLGFDITLEDVRKHAGEGVIGRPHLARALAQKRLVRSPGEAFARLLRDGGPAYVARRAPRPEEGIAWIREAKGAAVCAHPGLLKDRTALQRLLPLLDGLEAFHPEHSPSDERELAALAEEWGLVATGGSDSHGPGGKKGAVLGRRTVLWSAVAALEERASSRR